MLKDINDKTACYMVKAQKEKNVDSKIWILVMEAYVDIFLDELLGLSPNRKVDLYFCKRLN